MFDKKYKQGMKDGAKPFQDIDSRAAKDIRDIGKKWDKNWNEMADIVASVIKAWNLTPELQNELSYELEQIREKNKRPAEFVIKVVWASKQDEALAKAISQEIKVTNDCTTYVSYEEYDTQKGEQTDYTIFIQDPMRIAEYPNSEEIKTDIPLKKYFCKMVKCGNKIALIAEKPQNMDYTIRKEMEESYNEMVRNSHLMRTNADKKAVKELEKRKKRGNPKTPIGEWLQDAGDSISDKINEVSWTADEYSYKVWEQMDKMLDSDNLLEKVGGLLTVPVAVAQGAVSMGLALVSLVPYTPDMIDDATFDTQIVPVIQQRMLGVKICEYIALEKVRNSN